jgi:hypothetical protein
MTIFINPRLAFTDSIRTAVHAYSFWYCTDAVDLAAFRLADMIKLSADISREDCLAVGIRAVLYV